MKSSSYLCLLSSALAAVSAKPGMTQPPPDPPPGFEMVILNQVMYTGTIYDDGKKFGKIHLTIDGESFKLLGGTLEDRYAVGSGIDEKGNVAAFPVYDRTKSALYQEMPKATLEFAAAGKPGKGVRKLTGTIKTETGRTFEFEAPLFELPPLPVRTEPPQP